MISDKILKYTSSKVKDEDKTREELIEDLKHMRKLALANGNSRIMLDEMYQFVALLDHHGNLLDVNEPALHGGGMIRSNIVGVPFWDCRWWAVSEKTKNDCREAVYSAAQGNFIRYEVDIFGKSAGTETITIDFSLMPLFDDNGKVWLILPEGRNITEKKQAEDEISRKNDELRKLYEKIKELDELKTQFFANVSHELRTPLTLITHPTEKLLKDPTISAQSKKYLDVIARNTRGLLKHVNNLLDISKLEAGKMTVQYSMVDTGRTVGLIASCFELLARDNNLDYTTVIPEGPPLMAAIDSDKINRVITNLISNAFKFTPRGGKIRVSLDRSEMPNGEPCFDVIVSDSGPGVPDHLHSVIFDRFRQVDGSSSRKHGGTGLGLSIVKEFVELHKGTVGISQPKQGTGAVFTIKIPLSPNIESLAHKATVSDDNVSSRIVSSSSSSMTAEDNDNYVRQSMGSVFSAEMIAKQATEELEVREGYTAEFDMDEPDVMSKPSVLVVEDNVEMNRFIAELLATKYRIYTAYDGIEGLEKLKTHIPDLIVTDCMMPNMAGDEMVERIRQMPEYDCIPIVLLTAKADENMRIKLLNNGCSDYINKPFSAEELTARVGNLMSMKKAKQFLQEELKSANNDLGELVNELASKKRDLQLLVKQLDQERNLLNQANNHKDEFLMNLSHELRTPLNGILGWSQVLRYESDGEEVKLGIESIERCALAQNQLVNDLLDMSLIISGKLQITSEPINLSELIEKALVSLDVVAKNKNVKLEKDIKQNLYARGDSTRLQQVIWNLVQNAIKFSKEVQGTISIKLSRSDGSDVYGVSGAAADKVKQIFSTNKSWALIKVTDNGKGISAEFLPHVFDRFRQADCSSTRHYGGLGLGLSIVNNIIELHGGVSFAYSDGIGKGASFSILLPAENESLKRSRTELETSIHHAHNVQALAGLKIMVVDDLEETIHLLSVMLTKQGAKPDTYLSALDAFASLSTKPDTPDIILTDITMPNNDGYQFLQMIRDRETKLNLPHIPVIALTAAASYADKNKVQSVGFNMHIAKPVNLYDLTNSILKLTKLHQQSTNSPMLISTNLNTSTTSSSSTTSSNSASFTISATNNIHNHLYNNVCSTDITTSEKNEQLNNHHHQNNNSENNNNVNNSNSNHQNGINHNNNQNEHYIDDDDNQRANKKSR